MSGLINAAKEKIWAIANTMASSDRSPRIRMGLVGFRDRGDAYITKNTPLTDDLDKVYRDLMSFKADGGGDGPESVNQAINEAVHEFRWGGSDRTYRVIFLVGDSPPHMDYRNDMQYPKVARAAVEKNIIINTIQCGSNSSTQKVWEEIAQRAQGRYFRVEQSGGAILSSTPFDAKLARLARELDGTRIFYGDKHEQSESRRRSEASDEIYKSAPASGVAQRAVFNASPEGKYNVGGTYIKDS